MASLDQSMQTGGRCRIVDPTPNKFGPIGRLVAENVQDLRERSRLKQADVVERLSEQGVKMLKTTLSKIENGQRSITVDELVALAYVLEVSPLVLLLPRENVSYQVTPEETASARLVYEWMIGELRPPFPWPEDEIADEDRARAWSLFSRLVSYAPEPSGHWLVNAELERRRDEGPGQLVANIRRVYGDFTEQEAAGEVDEELRKEMRYLMGPEQLGKAVGNPMDILKAVAAGVLRGYRMRTFLDRHEDDERGDDQPPGDADEGGDRGGR